ncbi:MAG: penicillin-binding protein 2 [Gammaproteobacteria bacterium]|jgi:penicillin-binding protein 2|nr:penicillin-binding protein 2 [Gammaproteobacteria bacterium]MBT5203084.1 penicillin-binding protein 2 [Gammaproteobacteria bacterium]MBT5602748.1 penicillin-binding protein 2 [Gammaproteobacteria bacterium]MBT6247069.1 penicillin-binding protein 2 [Gammaproteobacteria bacterium]
MAAPQFIKDHQGESQVYVERAGIGAGILLILLSVLVFRMAYLQLFLHEDFVTKSDKNRIQFQPRAPVRGLIFDRHGVLIADNATSHDLTVTPERVESLDALLLNLESYVQINDEQKQAFYKKIKRKSRPFEKIPLLFQLGEEDIARIEANRMRLPGVSVEAQLVRHYPFGPLLAHAVGSVRRINDQDSLVIDKSTYAATDHIGKLGVERFYEASLLGAVGYDRVEVNALGRITQIIESVAPEPGVNLELFLDTSLQAVARDALGDRRGAVVAIDPSNGGILAMLSNPSYDPNLFIEGISFADYAALRDSPDLPLFNRALQGQYQPGSTIKPFLGLVGLSTGSITPELTIDDPGWFKLSNSERLYRDWNWSKTGTGGHGRVNLQKAIYRSCNVYFYQLAVDLGIDLIHDQLSLFGLGRVTIADLPEARAGLLPSRTWMQMNRKKQWFPGDTVNIAIGQGDLLVTPLQLATAATMMANRGVWHRPRMVSNRDFSSFEDNFKPEFKHVPDSAWDHIIDSMEMVVHRGNQRLGENGVAWSHIGRGLSYRMAGKSGTAQVIGIKQGEEYEESEIDERQRKHAWFIAFAPIENPRIALAVIVENGGGGSEFAAPVARQVIDHYLLKSDQSAEIAVHRLAAGLQ